MRFEEYLMSNGFFRDDENPNVWHSIGRLQDFQVKLLEYKSTREYASVSVKWGLKARIVITEASTPQKLHDRLLVWNVPIGEIFQTPGGAKTLPGYYTKEMITEMGLSEVGTNQQPQNSYA